MKTIVEAHVVGYPEDSVVVNMAADATGLERSQAFDDAAHQAAEKHLGQGAVVFACHEQATDSLFSHS